MPMGIDKARGENFVLDGNTLEAAGQIAWNIAVFPHCSHTIALNQKRGLIEDIEIAYALIPGDDSAVLEKLDTKQVSLD